LKIAGLSDRPKLICLRSPSLETRDQVNGSRQFAQLAKRLKCKRCRKKEAKLTVLDPIYPRG